MALSSTCRCLRTDATYDGKDTCTSRYFHEATYISYLPLAHSFELNMQVLLLIYRDSDVEILVQRFSFLCRDTYTEYRGT
jgi:hypothetical protein